MMSSIVSFEELKLFLRGEGRDVESWSSSSSPIDGMFLFCYISDLCHVGFARMAGRTSSIKIILCSVPWWGEIARGFCFVFLLPGFSSHPSLAVSSWCGLLLPSKLSTQRTLRLTNEITNEIKNKIEGVRYDWPTKSKSKRYRRILLPFYQRSYDILSTVGKYRPWASLLPLLFVLIYSCSFVLQLLFILLYSCSFIL
ncbi:hypothetical protein M6B38_254805 [Iris pallida]|uniref:Uncharacterized protein n=1 Tax=Iris pallida TaxID=29817 RepID=A0AAX6IG00_IRIPA|nr:hypothetical protein M6B38_116525 [Iris pallida]KAJ6852260.1 hypothetical protein M6B38_254805 [Iris pallida]